MIDQKASTDQLWEKWEDKNNEDVKNQILEHYLYLVDYHAERISTNLPSHVQRDEVKSLGMFGLYDAFMKFELKRDLKFETYASFRIRGSIIDGLRKEDWLSRSTREKAKRIEQATSFLLQKLQREPTAKEIAKHLNISIEEVTTSTRDTFFANILSIEQRVNSDSEDNHEGIGYRIADRDQLTPEEKILQSERHLELTESIEKLNENEQHVISLFYNEELTLTEIGQVLSLTTSRISQIHKQAIFKLKRALSLKAIT